MFGLKSPTSAKHGLYYPVVNRFGLPTPFLYWEGDGLRVALTSAEQGELVETVAPDDPGRRLHSDRYRNEMLQYLSDFARRDRPAFIQRHVYRKATGDAAVNILPTMVAAYSIVVGFAQIEAHRAKSMEELAMGVLPEQTVYTIHLLHPSRWPLQKEVPTIGALLLPAAAVQEVVGTIDNFIVAADRQVYRFAGGGVFVVDRRAAKEWRSMAGDDAFTIPVPD